MSDPVLTVCPSCGAPTFEKQVTAAGFQLKGSGWYVTDFRGGDKPAAGGESKADETKAGESKASDSASTSDASKSDAPAKSDSSAAPASAPAPAAPSSDKK